ncbi:MAG: hypothetical protein ACRC80_17175 [Waterburya sp.]
MGKNSKIDHEIKVAERGFFVKIGDVEFAIDKIKTKDLELLNLIVKSFHQSYLTYYGDLSVSENGFIYALNDVLVDYLENEVSRRKAVALLSSVTNSELVANLGIEDLHQLIFAFVSANTDYFLGKLKEVSRKAALANQALMKIASKN